MSNENKTSCEFGFMAHRPSLLTKNLSTLNSFADFIEFSINNERLEEIINDTATSTEINGLTLLRPYLTIHGEGELHGSTFKVNFCNHDPLVRKNYINFLSRGYNALLERITHPINAIILHPDKLSKTTTHENQIELFVESLLQLEDSLPGIELCVESRGSKTPHVLQPDLEQLSQFESLLRENGSKNVAHCLDIPQAYIYHSNENELISFLQNLHELDLPITEYHISDVRTNRNGHPQLGRVVGSGLINWKKFAYLFEGKRVLYEVLGGITTFLQSHIYIADLLNARQATTDNNSISLPEISSLLQTPSQYRFYFQKSKKSLLTPSPGSKEVLSICKALGLTPERVLDLGCGNGRNSLLFSSSFGSSITLVDGDHSTVEIARSNLLNHGYQAEDTITSKIEDLPLNFFGQFDVVICSYVLQNIHPQYYENIFRKLYHWTSKFCIIEVYRNEEIYLPRTFTYRDDVGWFGLTNELLLSSIEKCFGVEYSFSNNTTGPSTTSLVCFPIEEPTFDFSDIYNFEVTVRYVPKRILKHPSDVKKKKHRSKLVKTFSMDKIDKIRDEIKPIKIGNVEDFSFYLTNKSLIDSRMTEIISILPEGVQLSKGTLIYLASRVEGFPIMVWEISYYFGVGQKEIFQELKELQKSFVLPRFSPIPFERYLERYLDSIEDNELIRDLVKVILEQLSLDKKTLKKFRSKSPTAVAAGTLRFISQLHPEINLSTKELSMSFHISEVTIRNMVDLLSKVISQTTLDST